MARIGDIPFTLKQLRYLIALEETEHFREAAEACGIAQPSLSVQIKSLETAVGLTLVERGRGSVRLTQAGREVANHARDILDASNRVMDLSTLLQSGLGGTLRLGTSTTLGPYLMPYVVGELHKNHPDLRLYIREGAPRNLLRELNEGVHDLILTQLPVVGATLSVARLFREPLGVAMPVDHSLTDLANIEGHELSGATILSLSPDYSLHEQISALYMEIGAHLSLDYEGTSLDALRQMVALDMGLTFLPALYVRSEISGRGPAPQDVVVRPFRGRRFARSIGLVWRSQSAPTPAFDRLAHAIRDTARQFSELILES